MILRYLIIKLLDKKQSVKPKAARPASASDAGRRRVRPETHRKNADADAVGRRTGNGEPKKQQLQTRPNKAVTRYE